LRSLRANQTLKIETAPNPSPEESDLLSFKAKEKILSGVNEINFHFA
jgi:hypothetical protein